MTKKHFEALAAAIRRARVESTEGKEIIGYQARNLSAMTAIDRVTVEIADVLGGEHWGFDRHKFFTACGLTAYPCASCPATVDNFTVFPGGICLDCHEKKMRGKPIEAPDFSKKSLLNI